MMNNFQRAHEEHVRNHRAGHRNPPPPPPPSPRLSSPSQAGEEEHHYVELQRIRSQQRLQQPEIVQENIWRQVHEHMMVEQERVHRLIEEEEIAQLQLNREQNEQELRNGLYGEHNQLSQEYYQEDRAQIRGPPAPGSPDPDDSSSSSEEEEGHDNGPLFSPPCNNSPPIRLPPGGRPYAEPIQTHYLGPMDVQCPECHALHFDCKKLSKSTRARKHFGICCLEGKV